MMDWLVFFAILFSFSVLAYQRASLSIWIVSYTILLLLFTRLTHVSSTTTLVLWIIFAVIIGFFLIHKLRCFLVTKYILKFYQKNKPAMSRTEREALNAGTIGWEGELFQGRPNWHRLLHLPKATLTQEEEAFIAGPVETLCQMIDDWEITHKLCDLPPELWQFLKDQGFFALIIPKQYGGKEFSALAHSQILLKVYGKSTTVASTIAVPNSLGPAELLLHYGTDKQKEYYLPRLVRGEEIPCFALTGPESGSDAGAMTDKGIICWGEYEGKRVLGIQLSWDKRYITLAPVATLIGMAFKLYDPAHLIGQQDYLGITCALIPRETPGVSIGRRHFPCNIVFQNGPTQGKDVFIPMDAIIGGLSMVGQGWRMLMECLAAGRAISLPASAIGGGKVIAYAAGAYARIRHQFNLPIARFEGIEEVMARMMGRIYIMDAARRFTVEQIDAGEKPAVASAITKYHVTELGRMVANDAMDIHGGKGICLGPKNYLGRFYQSAPIAITVEGANILTRNMIIFGQGMMRCHPFVFAEFEAAQNPDPHQALNQFDKAFWRHTGFIISNFFRTFLLGLTAGRLASTPGKKLKRYFQQATRFSSAFALLTDITIMIYGGALKRKETVSARLGDIVSYLYLLSAIFKKYKDEGEPPEDLPIVRWSAIYCFYHIQQTIDVLLKNLPNTFLKIFLRFIIFPWGKRFNLPSDRLAHQVVQLFIAPTPSRTRLAEGAFLTATPSNVLGLIEDALIKVIEAEPLEKIVKLAVKEQKIPNDILTLTEQATVACQQKIITDDQLKKIMAAERARSLVIAVDDFDPAELTKTCHSQEGALGSGKSV